MQFLVTACTLSPQAFWVIFPNRSGPYADLCKLVFRCLRKSVLVSEPWRSSMPPPCFQMKRYMHSNFPLSGKFLALTSPFLYICCRIDSLSIPKASDNLVSLEVQSKCSESSSVSCSLSIFALTRICCCKP